MAIDFRKGVFNLAVQEERPPDPPEYTEFVNAARKARHDRREVTIEIFDHRITICPPRPSCHVPTEAYVTSLRDKLFRNRRLPMRIVREAVLEECRKKYPLKIKDL